MYILKNALRCISRAKGRNFLIGLVVLLLSVSSCIGLSIKEANRKMSKKYADELAQYADNLELTATVNPANGRKTGSLSLETLKELANDENVKEFQYSASVYFAAGDGIEPLDVAGSFKQNKEFREKYGDIRNGESRTTTETETETEETVSSTQSKTESTSVNKTGSAFSYKIVSTVSGGQDESGDEDPLPGNTPETGEGDPDPDNVNPDPNAGTPGGGNSPANGEETPGSDGKKPENGSGKSSESGNPSDFGGGSGMPQMPGGSSPPGGDDEGRREFITRNFTTNNFFFNMGSMNDFTVKAYNTDDAMPAYLSSLNALSQSDEALNCLISKSLAEENNLETGSTFTLKNPDNEDETYTFTVAGIFDSSQSTDSQDTSSNAAFSDNTLYISNAAMEKLLADSAAANPETEESEESDDSKTPKALTANYTGMFIFSGVDHYEQFEASLGDDYKLATDDLDEYKENKARYEQEGKQLEDLERYATYFLIVIFIIGAFVLVIINLFSIRNRKYEIGVLTAIGMKKQKVAVQFVVELFVVTFAALIIGSAIGSTASVPVTNKLLVSINTEQEADDAAESETASSQQPGNIPSMPENMPDNFPGGSGSSGRGTPPGGFSENNQNKAEETTNYIAKISSATDMTVILEMILVGMGLTLISSAAAVAFVMRYEPLKILNNRD